MMRYAITGHTGDIGSSLMKQLPNSIGFSKSTGCDLTTSEGIDQFIIDIHDCDIIFNLACDGYCQSDLLLSVYEVYKNRNKIVVSIGSKITDIILEGERIRLLDYQKRKIKLKETNNWCSKQIDNDIKFIYKTFGYIATEKMVKKNPILLSHPHHTVDQAVEELINAIK